jgi:hypothetical protein
MAVLPNTIVARYAFATLVDSVGNTEVEPAADLVHNVLQNQPTIWKPLSSGSSRLTFETLSNEAFQIVRLNF